MDNCFSLNPAMSLKKDDSVDRKTQNPLYSLSYRLAEKRQKYFSQYRKREGKATLTVIF